MTTADPSTPSIGIQHNAPHITAQQKQKLIDDLQSELTIRARELRSRAAMKAQSIASTVENRIMTVPSHLRKMTIGELLDGLQPATSVPALPSLPAFAPLHNSSHTILAPAHPVSATMYKTAGTKRTSEDMLGSDKENQGAHIEVPKKRSRVAAVPKSGAETKASRAASRKMNPSKVLSPKSHNSRTLQHSPIKIGGHDGRYYASRPASPVKAPVAPSNIAVVDGQEPPKNRATRQKAPAAKSTVTSTTAVSKTKRAAVPSSNARLATNRVASDSSTTSAMSTNTTIVTKKAAPTKKGVMSKVQGIASAASRKVAAVRKEVTAPETGKRVLRSRK